MFWLDIEWKGWQLTKGGSTGEKFLLERSSGRTLSVYIEFSIGKMHVRYG